MPVPSSNAPGKRRSLFKAAGPGPREPRAFLLRHRVRLGIHGGAAREYYADAYLSVHGE